MDAKPYFEGKSFRVEVKKETMSFGMFNKRNDNQILDK